LRLATAARYLFLTYLTKPACDRVLYRTIRQQPVRKILEIGIGTTARTMNLLDWSQRMAEGEAIRYAAVDLFEARPASQPKLSLKETHKLLKTTPVHAQLIPGDPGGALARVANSMPGIDLVLISAAHDDASLAGAWFYLPRMLHDGSIVLRELAGSAGWQEITPQQIRERAGSTRRRAA